MKCGYSLAHRSRDRVSQISRVWNNIQSTQLSCLRALIVQVRHSNHSAFVAADNRVNKATRPPFCIRSNSLRVFFPLSLVLAIEASLKGLRQKQSLTERMSEFLASARGASGQNRMGLAVTGDAVSAWFVREILPLEAILMHYLRSNWRNPSDIPDLRQETYTRVFEAARGCIPENPKRFLLTTARNLLINLVRRQQVVPMETFADFEVFAIADDALQADSLVIEKEELRRVKLALSKLPPRTREAIELAYFEGLSRTEIAARMKTTQQVASKSIARGTLILGRILYGAHGDRSNKS